MSKGICEIREIRIEELDEAMQLAQQWGGTMERSHVRRRLSLLARDAQEQVVGVALCAGDRGRLILEIAVSSDASDELERQLVDKALSKLRCEKVRRCLIRVAGKADTSDLWTAARWGATADAA